MRTDALVTGLRLLRSRKQVMRLLAVAMGCMMVAMTALAGAATRPRVPNVVGTTESRAQCTLAATGLRWRYRGDHHAHARPLVSCTGLVAVTPDPVVISESPRAGTRVARGSVIVLDDTCLRRVRQHRGACA
jgi:hypothetical protein